MESVLGRFGLAIQRLPSGKPIWSDDTAFCSLFNQIKDHTVVDRRRCFMIYQFAKHADGIDGQAAEVGVYKGGTAKLISKVLAKSGKTVHLFDTFSGMPVTDSAKDLHIEGHFSDVTLENVKMYLNDCPNVCFYQGLFPDTAAAVTGLRFSFVHVDADIYQSVLQCCRFFYPRMTKSAIMLFDDYGFGSCPGAKKAVDEFFSDKPESPCRLPTGQCFVIKL